MLSLHSRRESWHSQPQLQSLPALTYLNFARQKLDGALPEALTTMTSLQVAAVPNDNGNIAPSMVVLV